MKTKFAIVNALMSVVILFAILFQSLHSFDHLTKQLVEKKCLHKQVSDKQITHQHKDFDKCFVCEFAFSSCNLNKIQSFNFSNDFNFHEISSCFLKNSIIFFSGISYSLRGPPKF